MKLAAIDIGSNAVRLLIEEVVVINNGENFFRKISLTRVPIRLGEDVFGDGKITEEKKERLVKTIEAFKLLMQVNGVSHYRACATSAMREAKNGNEIKKYILDKVGVNIEIIHGYEEAELIFENFKNSKLPDGQAYLYIDVGGGSTEISLIKDKKKLKSKSFKLGTVRLLQGKAPESVWVECEKWLKDLKIKENVIAIGTGGNINRIFKENNHQFGKNITYQEIKSIVNEIEKYSYEERVNTLRLKPDRADVIIPAGKIYLTIMKNAKINEMIVPKVGLADGIIFDLYQRYIQNKA